MKIKAVTFDIWDTILVDDSDEPKRLKMGLKSKTETRIDQLWEIAKPHISRETVKLAYDNNVKVFNEKWHGQMVTEPVSNRVTEIFETLKIQPSLKEVKQLVQDWETMELQIKPDPVKNIQEALAILSKTYKLGIISDTVFSPGTTLRCILDGYGLLSYFTVFTFSDEVGVSKPNPQAFKVTLEKLGVVAGEAVHVGDRPDKDIDGPKAVGMKAILYTGVKNRDRSKLTYSPDAVVEDMTELPTILEKLSQ